jgi:hypothetical protein
MHATPGTLTSDNGRVSDVRYLRSSPLEKLLRSTKPAPYPSPRRVSEYDQTGFAASVFGGDTAADTSATNELAGGWLSELAARSDVVRVLPPRPGRTTIPQEDAGEDWDAWGTGAIARSSAARTPMLTRMGSGRGPALRGWAREHAGRRAMHELPIAGYPSHPRAGATGDALISRDLHGL